MAPLKRNIIFLKPTTLEKGDSTRDRELDRAAARAHSASVSFRPSARFRRQKSGGQTGFDVGLSTGDERVRVRHRARKGDTGPLTLLLEGNSDPFDALPISITPRVNEALGFFRTDYLPAVYGRKSLQTRSSAEELEWQAFLNCMHDECSALAFVFLQSVNLSQVKSMSASRKLSLDQHELALKTKSFAALRERIGKKVTISTQDRTILRSAILLYQSAIVRGDFIEAAMHGRSLASMLYEREWEIPTTPREQAYVGHMIWSDAHFCQRFMKPPNLDTTWALEKLKPVMEPVDQLLEKLNGMFVAGMDECLDMEPVRSAFIRDRFAGWLWTIESLPNGVDSEAAGFWVIATIHLVQGEMVSYALEVDERLRKATAQGELTEELECIWLTQQSLALGLVFAVWLFSAPSVGGYKIMWTAPVILSRLRKSLGKAMHLAYALEPSDTSDSLTGRERFNSAYLWILSKVAQSEHTFAKPGSNPWKGWGNKHFAAVAQRMQLSSWEAVHERLRKFLFHDGLEPKAATWVDETIKINSAA
jgi:hypothetical protein